VALRPRPAEGDEEAADLVVGDRVRVAREVLVVGERRRGKARFVGRAADVVRESAGAGRSFGERTPVDASLTAFAQKQSRRERQRTNRFRVT
jgi:hypothetical protein